MPAKKKATQKKASKKETPYTLIVPEFKNTITSNFNLDSFVNRPSGTLAKTLFSEQERLRILRIFENRAASVIRGMTEDFHTAFAFPSERLQFAGADYDHDIGGRDYGSLYPVYGENVYEDIFGRRQTNSNTLQFNTSETDVEDEIVGERLRNDFPDIPPEKLTDVVFQLLRNYEIKLTHPETDEMLQNRIKNIKANFSQRLSKLAKKKKVSTEKLLTKHLSDVEPLIPEGCELVVHSKSKTKTKITEVSNSAASKVSFLESGNVVLTL